MKPPRVKLREIFFSLFLCQAGIGHLTHYSRVLRSPTGIGTDVKSGGSQTKLLAPLQITFRKQKMFNDSDLIKNELSEIRK